MLKSEIIMPKTTELMIHLGGSTYPDMDDALVCADVYLYAGRVRQALPHVSGS